MSATNRNGLARHKGDFYETPAWAVDLLLDELGIDESFEGYVVDPGSGTGAIAHRVATRAPRADVVGIEANHELIEQARAARRSTIVFHEGDFLSWKPEGSVDLVVGNPPYGKRWIDGGERTDERTAEKFIRHAHEIVSKKGTVAMLLRASFLVAKVRRELRAVPCDTLLLETRPSFNGSGCDATDYAWFVWGPKRGGRWKVLQRR